MEVKVINRQKFLAELGRLLTFMYEEDRQTALAMYSKMFDDAADEQLLLQFLVSPTRQAVVLARTYDAKERKLQVHTQSREEDDGYGYSEVPEGELPPFILAIDDLQREAAARGIYAPVEAAPEVDENQFSLFDEIPRSAPEETPETVWAEPVAPAEDEIPAAEEDGPVSDSVSEFADAVDAFLADFSIADGALIAKKEGGAPERAAAEDVQPADALSFAEDAQPAEDASGEIVLSSPETDAPAIPLEFQEDAPPATRRKANVPLLILYIIFAVPLGLLGVAALLVPTLLSLSLAICFVSGGVLVLTAAFGGFAIFADLMVILGLAIILLALGLLLTWLFIWFIGGAIAGLIRGLCHLGGKWCYKEVPVQ